MKKGKGFLIIGLCFMMSLLGCSSEQQGKKTTYYKVVSSTVNHNLFYSGSIQPLKATVVQSKTEGVVVNMAKQYGEIVKANELLFVISSSKFLNDYKTALLQYIKAKNDFHQSETQLSEATFLHKNELISDDEFKLKQSAYYANQLGFIQSKDALKIFMTQMNVPEDKLFNLTIADVEKVKEAMHLTNHSESLNIIAPIDGVLLAPYKSEDENKKIRQGEACKEGDVLAVIGDMSGILIRVKVNEFAINQLALNQKVRVTGVAFPNEVLMGKISHIDRQGEGAISGQPTFSVDVEVKQLSPKQRQLIHVGMTANVEIELMRESRLMVPVTAIKENKGVMMVNRYDRKTKKIIATEIKTGKSTLDQVVVLSGLKEGDDVVLSA